MTSAGPAVAIDARRLQDDPLGGVGRALARMLPGIAARSDATVLADARRPLPQAPGTTVEALAGPPGLPELAWLHLAAGKWARRHPSVVFHGPFGALPRGLAGPAVVTIYDLSFEVHPEDFGPFKRRAFQVHARAAARSARVVVTASLFSADLLAARYDVPPGRMEVIPLAPDPLFGPAHTTPLPEGLGGHRYVVALGGARRRGLGTAVEAWRLARSRGTDVDLAVAGAAAGELGPEPGLVDLGRPDDPTWAAVLAGAEALLYPTRYEGFGFPALEAAASGTPVVCARVGSLPEVLGDAAAWCEAPAPSPLADRLTALLADPAWAAELRNRGLARAVACPTWDEIAAAHVSVYEAAG